MNVWTPLLAAGVAEGPVGVEDGELDGDARGRGLRNKGPHHPLQDRDHNCAAHGIQRVCATGDRCSAAFGVVGPNSSPYLQQLVWRLRRIRIRGLRRRSRNDRFSWTWLLAISEKLWPKLRIVNRTPMAVPSAPKLTAEPDQTRRPLGPLAGQDRGQRLPLQRTCALVRLEVDVLCCGHALAQHGLAAPAATTPDHQPRGRLPGTC